MRISWLDTAKAIGILLVLFGHTKGIDPTVRKYLYSFHLPLFFFLSGFVLKEKYLSGSFKDYFLRNVKHIVIPYVFFWFLSYPYWILNGVVKKQLNIHDISAVLKPFVGLFYGIGERLTVNDVLWYFTCLFCTVIIFYWIYKVNKWVRILLVFVFCFFGPLVPQFIGFRLPWNLEVSLVAVVFFGAGYLCKILEFKNLKKRLGLGVQSFFVVLAIITFVVSVSQNTNVNLSGVRFGNPVYFYLGAFSGIGLTIFISKMVSPNKILEWISKNTIVIFPLHILLFSVFTGVGVLLLGYEHDFNEKSEMSCFVYTLGAIIVCFPVSCLIRRYAPWMIGIPRNKNDKFLGTILPKQCKRPDLN